MEEKKLEKAIDDLTKMLIKEDFKTRKTGKEIMFIISKKDLIKFCINVIKNI